MYRVNQFVKKSPAFCVHYRAYNSPPLCLILVRTNPIHTTIKNPLPDLTTTIVYEDFMYLFGKNIPGYK